MTLLKMTLLNNIENNFCRRAISLFLFAGICAGMFMSVTMPAYAQEEVPEASETMPISLDDDAVPVSNESEDTEVPHIFTKPFKVNANKRYNQKQFDALLKKAKPYYTQMKNDREKDSFDKEFIKFYEKAKKEKVTDENGRLLENYIHAYDLGAPYTKKDIQNDINEARSYQRHSLFVSFFNNKEHKELQKVVESVNREMTNKRMNRNDREEKHRAIIQQLEKTKKVDEKVTNKMKYIVPAVFAVGAVLAITVYLCRKRRLGLGKKVLLGVMLGGTLVGFLCTDIRADQYGTLSWNSDYTQYQATNEYDWTSEGLPGVMTYETFNMTQESIADNGDITYGIWMGYWANVNGFSSWGKPVNVKIGDTNIVIQPTGKPFNKDIQWMKGKSITLKAGQTYSIDVSIYNVAESGFYKGTITVPKKIKSDIIYHGNGGTYDNGKKEFRETVKNGTAYKTRENFFARPGYKFMGWTEIRPDGSKVDWTSWINKPWTWTYLYDAHLYAQWEVLEYHVNYDANGGNGSMKTDTIKYGQPFMTSKNAFTRSRYKFVGWNEKADGTGTAWSLSSSGVYEANKTWTWTYTHDITLYAQWTPTSYQQTVRVRFENADGSFTNYAQAYQANHNYDSTFEWEFPESQQYQSAKVSYKVTGDKSTDVTVYRKKYTLTITGDDGVESVSGTGSFRYGSTASVSYKLKTGYKFVKSTGTNTDGSQNGSWTGLAGKEGTIQDTWSITCNRTIKVYTELINYSISYNLNGGSISGQKTSYNVNTETFTLPIPTKTWYIFTGWTGSNGATPQKSVTISKGSTGNKSYTANWKLDSYYIDYNVNDAGLTDHITDNLPDSNGSFPGKDTAAMLTDFALQKGSKYNTKYTFKEWNTKPDGGGQKFTTSITNDGSLCKPGETLTLYAIWDTTPIMSAKDFYLIEEVPAPNDVVYSGVGFDKTPTEKYPDKLSEVAYPIKGYTKNGTDISSRIKVEYVEFDGSKTAVSSIDTNKPGKYTVHYSLTDGKQTKKFTRTATVLPISAPAINAGDRYFKVNTLITADMLKETVSVNDKYDGDLIDKVIIENIDNIKSDKDGVYQITYKVTNRANKTTTKTVNIFIIDYLPDNRADEANKFRFVRKDCSDANDYCLQYFDNDSKWVHDGTLRELLMDSLSKSENETAIKKFKLSSKNK